MQLSKIKPAVAFLSARVLTAVLNMGSLLALAVYLPPADFGFIAISLSLVGLLEAVISAITPHYYQDQLSRHKNWRQSSFAATLTIELISLLTIVIAVPIIARFYAVNQSVNVDWSTSFFCALSGLSSVFILCSTATRFHDKYLSSALCGLVPSVIRSACVLYLAEDISLRTYSLFSGIGIIFAVPITLMITCCAISVRIQFVRPSVIVYNNDKFCLLARGFLARATLGASRNLDTIIIGQLLSINDAGTFRLIRQIASSLSLISEPISALYQSRIYINQNSKKETVNKQILYRTAALIAAGSTPFVIFTAFFSLIPIDHPWVPDGLFNERGALLILVISQVVSSSCILLYPILMAQRKEGIIAYGVAMGVLVQMLTLPLTCMALGVLGAALSLSGFILATNIIWAMNSVPMRTQP